MKWDSSKSLKYIGYAMTVLGVIGLLIALYGRSKGHTDRAFTIANGALILLGAIVEMIRKSLDRLEKRTVVLAEAIQRLQQPTNRP